VCTTPADTCRTEQECDTQADPTRIGCRPHSGRADGGARCDQNLKRCIDG
jgi:hypothetical protein